MSRRGSLIGRAIAVSALWLTLAQTALAQSMQYDAYYVLPGAAGVGGVDLVVSGRDVSNLADASSLDLSAKYSLTDQVEVGALARSGVLDNNLGRVSSLTVGAKYGFSTEVNAATVNLALPVGDVEKLGVTVGYLYTKAMGGLSINNALSLGWLDAFNGGSGVVISALVEPTRQISQSLMGYCDLIIVTHSDDLADELAIDLLPNIDVLKGNRLAVNLGVRLGLAGKRKQKEVGMVLGLLSIIE
jgi:hypothetical protein